jgi:hypothetical protein
MYPRKAAFCVGRWMRESYNAGVPEKHRIPCKDQYQNQDLYLDPQRLLPQQHVPLALTILARYYEVTGKTEEGAAIYHAAGSLYRDQRNRLSAARGSLRLNHEPMTEHVKRNVDDEHLKGKESMSC